MDKIEDMSHSYTLSDPYVVSVEEMEDESEQLAAENTDDSNHGDKSGVPLREQDRFLPIANIAKIMKRAIPQIGKVNNKIAKDARECVQECVSEFISFITSEASDRCHLEKRKTINGEDILFAMSALGFDNYVEPLKLYLQKYREAVKVDKNLHQGYEEIEVEPFTTTSAIATTDSEGAVIYTVQTSSSQEFTLGSKIV
ncbi:nuclear transcription factor Y subunit beta-like [Anthonomus grandis grandis]|uniref:nuclear transcription factor Y subunit beta-like n=1 Tax=Anthonomus grandis grandis TaxID=2921223 RepID=UPI0021668C61|nr:nuclear transcription factor Y subunit beta-like [Anthonomus grandis grandis]